MKYALVTDLHGNRESVTAVVAHARAQGARRWALLGDFVGYGADPDWVVDLVQELLAEGGLAVLGNHDAAVVSGPSPAMIPDARRVVEWTRARLSTQQLRFLAELPLLVVEGDCLFVHANAHAPGQWGYVDSRHAAVQSLQATDRRYTFVGHMHNPMLFHLSGTGKAGDFVPVPGVEIALSPQRQWLVVPGSAGQPRDGNPAACYALFESDTGTLTYHRVPYDHQAAGAKIQAAGLPQRLAARLQDGD